MVNTKMNSNGEHGIVNQNVMNNEQSMESEIFEDSKLKGLFKSHKEQVIKCGWETYGFEDKQSRK